MSDAPTPITNLSAAIGQAEQREPKLTLYFHGRASNLGEIDAGMPIDAVGLYSCPAAP